MIDTFNKQVSLQSEILAIVTNFRPQIIKHLMTDPKGNSKFCFAKT